MHRKPIDSTDGIRRNPAPTVNTALGSRCEQQVLPIPRMAPAGHSPVERAACFPSMHGVLRYSPRLAIPPRTTSVLLDWVRFRIAEAGFSQRWRQQSLRPRQGWVQRIVGLPDQEGSAAAGADAGTARAGVKVAGEPASGGRRGSRPWPCRKERRLAGIDSRLRQCGLMLAGCRVHRFAIRRTLLLKHELNPSSIHI